MENISKAIIAVMTEVNGVAKSMTVWSGKNSYQWVSDKDVKTLMRESMIKNWLSILPIAVTPKFQIDRWEEADQYNNNAMKSKQSIFTEVETKYLLLHTSWESIELAGYWHGVDTQDKWAGKATTYALKNTLLNMFLVPTGVDTDDTHSDDHPIPKKTTTPKTEYARKTDEHGLTLDDYIENINMEDNIDTVRVYFERWLKLCTTEKQATFFTSVKDKRKKALWF